VVAARGVEAVAEVADERLDRVFDGDYPLEGAPLVDDGGHLTAFIAELHEQIAQRRGLRNDHEVACEIGSRDRLVTRFTRAQHVFRVNEADHAVCVVSRYRVPGVTRVEYGRADRGEVRAGRDARHVRSGTIASRTTVSSSSKTASIISTSTSAT